MVEEMTDASTAASFDDPTTAPLKFGEPVYRACDSCGRPIEIVPLLSGNTLGGTLWSDGYMDTPQLPEQPLLARCRGCNQIVCLADLASVELQDRPSGDSEHGYLVLGVEDFRELLTALDDVSQEYQAYVRIKFWHLSNDRRRHDKPDLPLAAEERGNLLSLLELLGNDDASRLMKAEIYRELGEFELSAAILTEPFSERLDALVMKLAQLVAAQNKQLAVVFSGVPLP